MIGMGSVLTMDVMAAGAGLEPCLQAASWEGQIAAVFQRSLLCAAPDEHLLHLHAGPRLESPFSLRIEADFAKMLHMTPFKQGMPVRKMDLTIAITGLLAQGETSGSDAMLGLLTCLEALLSSPDREPRRERQDAAITSAPSAAMRM